MPLTLNPLTRPGHRWLVLLVAALAALPALACEIAAGETRRGPEPYRPAGDALASGLVTISFPWSAGPGGGGVGEIVQSEGDVTSAPVTVTISAGGTGVSLRNDCADGARAGGAWPDNTQVNVLEYGTERCAGWTRASTGTAGSWVRDEYLAGLPPPGQRVDPGTASAAPIDPSLAELKRWTDRVTDGAGRVALLSRHSPESAEQGFTMSSLEHLETDMRELATEVTSAEPATSAACSAARRSTIDAANAVGEMAKELHTVFGEQSSDASGIELLVTRYLTVQKEAARLIGDCEGG